jgi:DNA repair protein RecO (recombination protein O)
MQAIILNRRDYRETDQIISLYTRDQGKLDLLARGAKKVVSKNSAHLELFSLVEIQVQKGKEIDHLTKVQSVHFFSSIRKKFEKSLAAGYVVSLTDRLTQVGETESRIFEILESWLKFVENVSVFNSALVDGYIVRLLNCLGYRPELKHCVVCGVKQVNGFYPAGGGVICKVCRDKKEKLGQQIFDCSPEQATNLTLLLEGNWQLIGSLKFEGTEFNQLHNLVLQYAVFHSEKKLVDWARLDKALS